MKNSIVILLAIVLSLALIVNSGPLSQTDTKALAYEEDYEHDDSNTLDSDNECITGCASYINAVNGETICKCTNEDAAVMYRDVSTATGGCIKGDTLKFEEPSVRNQLITMALNACENQGCVCDRSVPLSQWARKPGMA